MNRLPLASISFILACATVCAEPAATAPASPQAPVQVADMAPATARGMVFEFTCTEVEVAEGGSAVADAAAYDRTCTFRSMDRAELEIPQADENAPEDEHLMRVFTYTKTGADTAVVLCKESLVYDDGREQDGAAMEISLRFTGAKDGEAVFTAPGCSGKGNFTLHH